MTSSRSSERYLTTHTSCLKCFVTLDTYSSLLGKGIKQEIDSTTVKRGLFPKLVVVENGKNTS